MIGVMVASAGIIRGPKIQKEHRREKRRWEKAIHCVIYLNWEYMYPKRGMSVEVNVVDNVCADSFIEGLYKALALE